MRIFGAKTVKEFKEFRTLTVQEWIDSFFVPGSVTWSYVSNHDIRITDKNGDSMVVSLDDIDMFYYGSKWYLNYFLHVYEGRFGNERNYKTCEKYKRIWNDS